MPSPLSAFETNVSEARSLSALYTYLTEVVKAPLDCEDVLRSQIVYVMSAFDKLIHDLIRLGVVGSYLGTRVPTDRYHAEPITMKCHADLISATVPPKEVIFEQEIVRKLSKLSFQDPDKVADGLALIWDEKHKWKVISGVMGWEPHKARTKLKLIAARRNAIVHEFRYRPP